MKFPFGRSKVQKIETTIASLAKRGEQLAAKRADAQEALEKATSARQRALLAGDLDDQRALDKLQAAVDTAGSALTGLDDALAILAKQKTEADAQLNAERDRIERAAAADKLDNQVAAIEAAAAPWLEQSRIYADTLAELAHWHFGADEMSNFLQNCLGQMETALNFQLNELKAMPQMIRDGRQAIPAPQPAPAPVLAPEPTPETRRLFALRQLKWKDAAGRQCYGQQFEDCDLPPATAEKALRCGAVTSLDDDRRKQLRGSRGGHHVNPHTPDLLDLDALEGRSGARHASFDPVLARADFRVIDRSKDGFEIAIPAQRAG
jgi:hypothetical protein